MKGKVIMVVGAAALVALVYMGAKRDGELNKFKVKIGELEAMQIRQMSSSRRRREAARTGT